MGKFEYYETIPVRFVNKRLRPVRGLVECCEARETRSPRGWSGTFFEPDTTAIWTEWARSLRELATQAMDHTFKRWEAERRHVCVEDWADAFACEVSARRSSGKEGG